MNKTIHTIKTLHRTKISPLTKRLLADEAISGKLIVLAVIAALAIANSPLRSLYDSLLALHMSICIGNFSLDYDLKHWINDGLMTIFFLVVGLELRREISEGKLKGIRNATLPFAAAIGGMVVPALIFTAFNYNRESLDGWAIPVATDIALALGVLALLGRKIPSSLRLFLLTLAIIDDIIAVTIIALFYTNSLNPFMLCIGTIWILLMIILTRRKMMRMSLFVAMSMIFWLIVNVSGVHVTIAGAIIGLIAPLSLMEQQRRSIADRLESATIPLSTLVIVPLFAFANTGIVLSFSSFEIDAAPYLASGIIFGLVLGKTFGVLLATWLLVRFARFELPRGVNWSHIIGIGMLAGIGFTISLFVTELAFTSDSLISVSKISIFIASIASAILGLITLRLANKRPT